MTRYIYGIVKGKLTYFSFFLDFFFSAPAELDRPRLALASDFTELCEPERLLLLFLSFDLSRPLALAFSISIASDAPGWFLSLWPVTCTDGGGGAMQRSTQQSLLAPSLVPQPSVVHAVMSVHAGIMAVGPSAVIAAVKAQKQYLFFHPPLLHVVPLFAQFAAAVASLVQ